MNDNKYIGLFDSGIGGLTVVNEIFKQLPYERVIYFGDTARVPYGTKSSATVNHYAKENTLFLNRFPLKFLIIACNTVSAVAENTVIRNSNVPVIGVIKPGAEGGAKSTNNNKVGVIGTTTTIQSGEYKKNIIKFNNNIDVISVPCPLFVSLVEEGWLDKPATFMIAEEYFKPLINADVDTIVMGCTHYPLLKDTFRKVVGKKIKLIDSAYETVKKVKESLKNDGLLNNKNINLQNQFYVSDDPVKFQQNAKLFLKNHIETVELIDEHELFVVNKIKKNKI